MKQNSNQKQQSSIIKFFDVLEDKIRFKLSKRPLVYAFISGIGTVLFFRGIWLIADEFEILNGIITLIVSLAILLLTGSFLSHFIANEVIISGLKKEKKLMEKNQTEILSESAILNDIKDRLDQIDKKLEKIK